MTGTCLQEHRSITDRNEQFVFFFIYEELYLTFYHNKKHRSRFN